MKRLTLAASLTAAWCLGFTVPLLAAQPPEPAAARKPSPDTNAASKIKVSKTCLSDLGAFDSQMQKDGYWLGGSGYGGYGYGYPIYGYGYDAGVTSASSATGTRPATDYQWGQPGYEIRTPIASANILAQRSQQQTCEALLIATHDIYKGYAADMRKTGMAMVDMPNWRGQQSAKMEAQYKVVGLRHRPAASAKLERVSAMQRERDEGKNGGRKSLVPDGRLLRADGRDYRPDRARLLSAG